MLTLRWNEPFDTGGAAISEYIIMAKEDGGIFVDIDADMELSDNTARIPYLRSGTNYHFRSIQDTTIITNKGTTTAMQATPSFTADTVATLKLIELGAYKYTVTLQGVPIETNISSTNANSTTFDDMLIYDSGDINNHHLVDQIVTEIEAQHTANNDDFLSSSI